MFTKLVSHILPVKSLQNSVICRAQCKMKTRRPPAPSPTHIQTIPCISRPDGTNPRTGLPGARGAVAALAVPRGAALSVAGKPFGTLESVFSCALRPYIIFPDLGECGANGGRIISASLQEKGVRQRKRGTRFPGVTITCHPVDSPLVTERAPWDSDLAEREPWGDLPRIPLLRCSFQTRQLQNARLMESRKHAPPRPDGFFFSQVFNPHAALWRLSRPIAYVVYHTGCSPADIGIHSCTAVNYSVASLFKTLRLFCFPFSFFFFFFMIPT